MAFKIIKRKQDLEIVITDMPIQDEMLNQDMRMLWRLCHDGR